LGEQQNMNDIQAIEWRHNEKIKLFTFITTFVIPLTGCILSIFCIINIDQIGWPTIICAITWIGFTGFIVRDAIRCNLGMRQLAHSIIDNLINKKYLLIYTDNDDYKAEIGYYLFGKRHKTNSTDLEKDICISISMGQASSIMKKDMCDWFVYISDKKINGRNSCLVITSDKPKKDAENDLSKIFETAKEILNETVGIQKDKITIKSKRHAQQGDAPEPASPAR